MLAPTPAFAAAPPQSERRATLVPVWREIDADLETPVSAYLKLTRGDARKSGGNGRYAYLLESVEGGERLARYSFVGVDPYLVLRVRDGAAEYIWLRGGRGVERAPCADPLIALRAELERRPVAAVPGLPRFSGGAVGYLSYEAAARYEPTIPIPASDPLGLPDAIFCFSDTLLAFDHARHRALLITHAALEAGNDAARAHAEAHARLDDLERRLSRPLPIRRAAKTRKAAETAMGGVGVTPSRLALREAYAGAVSLIQEYIRAGDCFQVVPSRRVARPTTASPLAVYRALRSINPSPYMFFLALGDFAVAGASPELLVRVERGEVAVHPIAGTRRRGADPAADAALEAELRADEKERAEHVMLVDLGRNDVGRVCEPGSVRVSQLLDVERYSHVMHLVSHVTGRLRAGLTAYDALRAGFPAGTVTGAPKVRAMQIVAELEGQRRGLYAGAVGHFGFDGSLDTCIAIRTLVIKDGIAYAQAGGGIVADSRAEDEFDETENKLGAVLRALEVAECSC
jgi:anthranilate synthase component 1